MLKKAIFTLALCALLFALLPATISAPKILQVFHIVKEPDVITRGTQGSALTIDLSFGDEPIEEWLARLEAPYPLLLIDPSWAKRFPESARLIAKKNIPVALLGENGASYEEDPLLLGRQIEEFVSLFDKKPLWFRTKDEYFPDPLRSSLWKEEVNALGSTVRWKGGKLPAQQKGEIVAVPLDDSQHVSVKQLDELLASRTFQSVEDVLFATTVKTRKIPE